MTAWLTLAEDDDRWEQRGCFWYLKGQGNLWVLHHPRLGAAFPVLKPHVANWCRANIRTYRIFEHGEPERAGPGHGDSWRIEFRHDGDMLLFLCEWGEH